MKKDKERDDKEGKRWCTCCEEGPTSRQLGVRKYLPKFKLVRRRKKTIPIVGSFSKKIAFIFNVASS